MVTQFVFVIFRVPISSSSIQYELAVSYWVNKLVDQSLRHVGLADDAFLVVLTYGTAQLVVVHCRSILSLSPQSRHVSRVFDFENTWWESKAVITTQHNTCKTVDDYTLCAHIKSPPLGLIFHLACFLPFRH